MITLQEILIKARQNGKAIGHFNISNVEMLRGILEAAKSAGGVPVMIGTSEGEAAYIGRKVAAALVRAAREEYGVPVFLNADHHKSVKAAKEAIDAGYDSVHIDLSKLPYEENLQGTKEVVEYARSKVSSFPPASACGTSQWRAGRFQVSGISVEGELGYLPTESSKIYKEEVKIDPASLTKPEEATEFVRKTGIDRFAAAVGNLHGIAANEPQLDLNRIRTIRAALPEQVAFVLHGGSGIPVSQVKAAIEAGMNNVHVSTEIRVAYMQALRQSLAASPDETTPYKLMSPAVEAVKQKVLEKFALF